MRKTPSFDTFFTFSRQTKHMGNEVLVKRDRSKVREE